MHEYVCEVCKQMDACIVCSKQLKTVQKSLSLSLSHIHKCINETWVLLLETYRLLKFFLPRRIDFIARFTYLV